MDLRPNPHGVYDTIDQVVHMLDSLSKKEKLQLSNIFINVNIESGNEFFSSNLRIAFHSRAQSMFQFFFFIFSALFDDFHNRAFILSST